MSGGGWGRTHTHYSTRWIPSAFDHEGVFEPGGVWLGDRLLLLNEPPSPLGFSMRGRPPTPALPAAMIDWPLPCPAAPVLVIRVGPPRAVGLMSRLRSPLRSLMKPRSPPTAAPLVLVRGGATGGATEGATSAAGGGALPGGAGRAVARGAAGLAGEAGAC